MDSVLPSACDRCGRGCGYRRGRWFGHGGLRLLGRDGSSGLAGLFERVFELFSRGKGAEVGLGVGRRVEHPMEIGLAHDRVVVMTAIEGEGEAAVDPSKRFRRWRLECRERRAGEELGIVPLCLDDVELEGPDDLGGVLGKSRSIPSMASSSLSARIAASSLGSAKLPSSFFLNPSSAGFLASSSPAKTAARFGSRSMSRITWAVCSSPSSQVSIS